MGRVSCYRNLVPAVVLLLSWWASMANSSSSSTSGSGSSGPAGAFPLAGIAPDPFVEASPLVVGVVCRDGVLLLAVHSIFSEASNEDEWSLMVRESDLNDDGVAVAEEDSVGSREAVSHGDIDLPRGYRGPFRIHALGADAGALVCAGFRTDGTILADRLRSFAQTDERVFGIGATDGGAMADRAAAVLAKQAVSEGRRSLSCAGLLATSGGRLYAVDATGAYAVRAHALGRGSRDLHRTVLCRTDWTQLDHRTVRERLLRSLGLLLPTDDDGDGDDPDDGTATPTTNVLPKGSRIEMAVVEPLSAAPQQQKTMKRLFAPRA